MCVFAYVVDCFRASTWFFQRDQKTLCPCSAMSQPRRSARIAARLAQLQPILLDDDDTDSVVSGSSRCEVCHEPAPRSALVHIPCCNYSTHRLCVDDGVEAMCPYCSMDLRQVLGQGVHLRCPLCGDSCGEESDTVMFSCCPGAAFHVSCMATVVPGGREVISCPMCPESVRDHVSVERFQRLCHISGVPWPQLQPSLVPVECTLCVDVMSDDTSVQVPCCQQHLHISCLVRSFTSCGFHCPFCNQCLSDFARSGSFQAAVILQGCAMDMDAQPSNQGSNSLVVPAGYVLLRPILLRPIST